MITTKLYTVLAILLNLDDHSKDNVMVHNIHAINTYDARMIAFSRLKHKHPDRIILTEGSALTLELKKAYLEMLSFIYS